MNKRVYSLDTMKAIAALMVIMIHFNPFKEINQIGFLIVDSFSRTAVPFFFMCSGFLFAYSEIRIKTDELIRKRVYQLFIIHVVWGSFYYFSHIISGSRSINIKDILKGIFISGLESHLWFFPALIYAMLILYIFIKIRKVKYCIYLGIALYILGLFGENQIFSAISNGIISINTRNLIFESLIFVSAGYMIYSSYRIEKFIKNISNIKLILITSFAYIAMITEKFFEKDGDYNIILPFTSILIFMLIIKNRELGKNSIINKMGKYSLGIYLIHLYFVYKLKGVIEYQNKYITFGANILAIILMYIGSLFIYWVVIKIYNNIKLKKLLRQET